MDAQIVMNESDIVLTVKAGGKTFTRRGFGQITQFASGKLIEQVTGQFTEDLRDFIKRNKEAIMKVKEVNISASNKFTPKQYQSIEIVAGMTMEPEEGDKLEDVFEEAFATCAGFVKIKKEPFATDLGY